MDKKTTRTRSLIRELGRTIQRSIGRTFWGFARKRGWTSKERIREVINELGKTLVKRPSIKDWITKK